MRPCYMNLGLFSVCSVLPTSHIPAPEKPIWIVMVSRTIWTIRLVSVSIHLGVQVWWCQAQVAEHGVQCWNCSTRVDTLSLTINMVRWSITTWSCNMAGVEMGHYFLTTVHA